MTLYRTEANDEFDEDELPTRAAAGSKVDGFTADEAALYLDDDAWDAHCRGLFGKVPMGSDVQGGSGGQ